jgi:uncharacterized protein
MSRWFAVLTLALAFLAFAEPADSAPAPERQKLEISTKRGVRVFSVELAATEETLQRGLMFRRNLPAGQGMLFDFGRDQEVAMWMKNTFIPLDMLFILNDGRIHRIEANTKPQSTDIIRSEAPVRAVLEVPAGTTRKLGIAPGDQVIHPVFSTR